MIRAVIVRAIRDHGGEAVGPRPGRDEVIRGGLRGGIGRTRIVARLFDERAVLAERAVNFVGRDMQETEGVALTAAQRLPMGAGRLQHRESAHDVCLDEGVAARDRAVDVTLGGEMDHLVRMKSRERLGHGAPIANVDLGEAVVRRVADRRQGLQISGVGERVDIEHRGALGDQMPAHGRADESGPAGHEHFSLHEVSWVQSDCPRSASCSCSSTHGGANWTVSRRLDALRITRMSRAQHAASDARHSGSLQAVYATRAFRCRGGNWPGAGRASDSPRWLCA